MVLINDFYGHAPNAMLFLNLVELHFLIPSLVFIGAMSLSSYLYAKSAMIQPTATNASISDD